MDTSNTEIWLGYKQPACLWANGSVTAWLNQSKLTLTLSKLFNLSIIICRWQKHHLWFPSNTQTLLSKILIFPLRCSMRPTFLTGVQADVGARKLKWRHIPPCCSFILSISFNKVKREWMHSSIPSYHSYKHLNPKNNERQQISLKEDCTRATSFLLLCCNQTVVFTVESWMH